MYILIILLILMLIIILFRKKFLNIIKKVQNDRRILIFLIPFIIVICIIFIGINYYIKNNPQEVEKNKCEMVESYILQEYNIDGKIKASWFARNEDGVTGGLFIYTFKVKDVNGKNFFIDYMSYSDLSKETLDRLEIRDEK